MSDEKLQKAHILIVLIEAYYETNPTGGTLHIVLDDGNYGKGCVKSCITDSIKYKDYWGELIGTLLLNFTTEEQEKIIERPWEVIHTLFHK
tara:strand:+ start:467 stop:739 length:273 start_codon:yes stop_codon:yes gene_type:complete